MSLTLFTVISPSESIYLEDCHASTPFTSPGVIYFQKTMPAIQYLITHLQNISSCHQLGPIDLFGLGSPTTSGTHGLPAHVKSLTFQMLPTSTPNVNVTKPQAVGIGKTKLHTFQAYQSFFNSTELAAIGVVPLVLVAAVAGWVLVIIVRRRHQRRKETKEIIEEIKNIHSNSYGKGTSALRRCPITKLHLCPVVPCFSYGVCEDKQRSYQATPLCGYQTTFKPNKRRTR